ncbi:nucleolar pre-ribosomal-associated protein 1 [Neocloeon triangulifer]|uniref:nucleolar pre-ribosomal-associated protein 1 n=1 Tax=Neocloeon triangulifer TaxID=2078957 RepID=UPI00286F7599|nr:nucleolar pre-ribosomal-associated protein 1 [Neocloeon triangulifer]
MPAILENNSESKTNRLSTKMKRKKELSPQKMEVDEKNGKVKRKRKIEEVSAMDEENKGDRSSESELSDGSNGDEFEESVRAPEPFNKTRVVKFDANFFRRKIFSREGGTELKLFAKLLNEKEENDGDDYIKEYIDAGGSAREILEALSQFRHAEPGSAMAALKILTILFLKTLREYPEKQVEAEEVALQLIQTAAPFLNSLLISKHRPPNVVTGLKLLTAMVSLSPKVGKEVLRVISLGKDEIWFLTSHGNKPNERGNVHIRKNYLFFLMAFLIDKDSNIIQLLMAKENVVGSALLGLMHDAAPIVNLILTTLRSNVIENLNVVKRLKQSAFNTRVLEALVTLYEWQGQSKLNRYRKKKKIETASEEELHLVQESIHAFLKTLLTSYKYGVVFQTTTTEVAKNHNQQAFSVLRKLQRPWDCPLRGDLLISVLKACPTLLKPTLAIYTEALTPRPTLTWVKSLEFFIKVLESVDMGSFTIHEPDRPNPKMLTNMICCIALPVSLLSAVLTPGLSNSHAAVKEATCRLLSCVFSRLSLHLRRCQELFHLHENFCDSVRSQIQHQLSNILPHVSLIWEAWNLVVDDAEELEDKSLTTKSTKKLNIPTLDASILPGVTLPAGPQSLRVPTKSDQLATYLSALLGYQDWLPHWLEMSWGGKSSTKILSSIKSAVDLLEGKDNNDLKMKAVSLLTNLDQMTISPNQTIFSWAIEILVNGSYKNPEACSTLLKILQQIGVLLENDDELEVWILSTSGREDCKTVLSSAIVLLSKNLVDFTEKQYELISRGEVSSTKSHIDQLDDMLEELQQEDNKISGTAYTGPYQDVAFSPLLVVLLQLAKEKSFAQKLPALQHMVQGATIQLLLQQPSPHYLINVIKSNIKQYPAEFSALIQDCSSFPMDFLSSTERKFFSYLNGENSKLPKSLELPESQLKQLCRLVVYNAARKVDSGKFDESALKTHWKALEKILNKMTSSSQVRCLELVICHPVMLDNFSLHEKSPSSLIASYFLLKVIPLLGEHPALTPLRLKALHELKKSLAKDGAKLNKLEWCHPKKLGDLLLQLSLDVEDVQSILKKLLHLPSTVWTSQGENVSQLLACLLSSILQRILALRNVAAENTQNLSLSEKEMTKILEITSNLLQKEDLEFERLENSLHMYLSTYPHHVRNIATDFPLVLLKKESEICLKLAQICVTWSDCTDLQKLENWAKHVEIGKSLPIYRSLLRRSGKDLSHYEAAIWPEIQETLFETLISAIHSDDDKKALLGKNKDAVLKLIEECYDKTAASKKILKLLQTSFASDTNTVQYMCSIISKGHQKSLPALVLWLLKSIVKLQVTPDDPLMSTLCEELLRVLRENSDSSNLFSATSNDDMFEFYKATLNFDVGINNRLLKLLAVVISKNQDQAHSEKVFSLILSHNQILKCLLGHEEALKVRILEVIDAVTTANHQLMEPKLVPVLLGAYNASLNLSDQIILKLLQKYEKKGVSFKEFQPLLWGDAATTRYSLRSQLGQSLKNLPSPSQVLKNLDPSRVSATLNNFPLDRGFEEVLSVGDGRVYDPAFLLPLFAYILLPEVPLQPWLFTRNALPITLMALSSNVSEMRRLAMLTISRLYFHYEAGKISFENKLWLNFMDTVRLTISNCADLQLAPVIALFLARSSQVISNPEHDLYTILNKFLLAKSSIDTSTLPEFLRLLHSSVPGHKTQRQWMLNLMKDGMRTQKDFDLFFSSFAFKILSCLYNSPLSDPKSKIDVLQVIAAVAKIPGASKRLLSSSGLMSWIAGAIVSLPPAATSDIAENLITLLQNIWENSDVPNIQDTVLYSVSLLIKKIPAQSKLLLPLIKLLTSIFRGNAAAKESIAAEELVHILDLCKKAGIRNYCLCKDLLQLKVAGDCEFEQSDLEREMQDLICQWIL